MTQVRGGPLPKPRAPSIAANAGQDGSLVDAAGSVLGDQPAAASSSPYTRSEATALGWTLHVYLDHSIIEVIVNNETAFVVYAAPAVTAGQVALFGDPSERRGASLTVWTLAPPRHAYNASMC